MTVLIASVAGGLGAAARFVLDGLVRGRTTTIIPVGTTIINVSGSFALGIITGLVAFHGAPPSVGLVAGTGFLGGYTTFSTASFEAVRLLQEGSAARAVLHVASMLVGGLAAAAAGLGVAWVS